ncbi:hypothetical protein GE21DRAFT_9571 [Neurospora crassa]|uniref:C2H2-type domain-containing protein n=1 Tax=Neurospora crassa (strain ATCC 24698 / 74-OR23-1A / CBS 708.71 / DSM 1257 / FGSC 987) TaxID=367110 RepID=Q7RX53_NEUCR|nr:hypothetical protein NCU05035 [Neurospora crassa OR74A]EAA27107.3 hypothetical protein NCU05035 [Neurospora crassa OR74A]KHE83817.1 hypothetical protein GE21DRAFT_9571 [Neurospora crassa]|eukprot:XP_956343.3 hypothetical protein NCU05035 [Neurospora crassa OR74A]
MSDHVNFLYMIPNGSASSSSQRVGMVGDGVKHRFDYTNLSHPGDAFGCPIGSSGIDPALLQTEDKGSHHLQMQEALALRDWHYQRCMQQKALTPQAWHYKRFMQLCKDVERIQSRISNNFSAPSTTSAPAAYEQWTPASFPHGHHSLQTGNHCSASSNDFPRNNPFPPFDSSKFMTWDPIQEAGSTFTHDSSLLRSQMDRGMVDIQMNGKSTATLSGPSQRSNSTEFDLFTSFDQSSSGRRTPNSEISVPSGVANAPSPSPERQEWSHTPAPGPKSSTSSSSDRISCPINTCGHTSGTKRDMQRHIDDKHDDRPEDLIGAGWSLSPEKPCTYMSSGCTFKFRREDRFKRHLERVKHRLR